MFLSLPASLDGRQEQIAGAAAPRGSPGRAPARPDTPTQPDTTARVVFKRMTGRGTSWREEIPALIYTVNLPHRRCSGELI